jgi:hypothetical protein
MTLQRCLDLSRAAWIVGSELPWDRLVGFGPAGFEAYARLRFLPDPQYPGQSENAVEVADGRSDAETLSALIDRLATRTSTPEDCYFCLWDGWGALDPTGGAIRDLSIAKEPDPNAVPGWAPRPAPDVDDGPKIMVPNRSYYLFRGRLSDLGDWGLGYRGVLEPAFIWPADHAWCVAKDVDPHWAGLGADRDVVDALVADPGLDVVAADPAERQPFYR